IQKLIEDRIRPYVTREYLKLFSEPVATSVENFGEFEQLVMSIASNGLRPYLDSVQLVRTDGETLTEADRSVLAAVGFSCHARSARLIVEEKEKALKGANKPVKETFLAELRAVSSMGYKVAQVTRRPLSYDITKITGKPFHWNVDFPEASPDVEA